ncbi:MAG: hypothetical protein AMXMBFR84_04300 [Candidatus Hydrogenedentota bacterium]
MHPSINPVSDSGVFDLSVVIPVYNEEESLYELRDELFPVLQSLGKSYEIVFVDDGSTDRSAEILREFFEANTFVRVVTFVRNFGQQMSYTAGLRYTRGQSVILMDADLQSPACHIPDVLAKLNEGFDVVYGRREKLIGPLYRRLGTRLASFLIRRLTGLNIPDSASGFLGLSRRLVVNVNKYDERARYLNGLFAYLAYGRSASVPVTRRERKYGESKYNFFKLAAIVLTFIARFSNRPLHLALWASGLIGALAVIALVVAAALAGTGRLDSAAVAFVASLVLGGNGIVLAVLGIMGDYIGRIYGEVRQQPPFLIAEVLDREPMEPFARWSGNP